MTCALMFSQQTIQTSIFVGLFYTFRCTLYFSHPHRMRMFMTRLKDLIQLSISKEGEARKERQNCSLQMERGRQKKKQNKREIRIKTPTIFCEK